MDLEEKIEQIAKWIAEKDRVVVFTGAGISTESGLPDFRGPDGVWTRRDKGLPPPKGPSDWSSVEPNRAHTACVELQNMGKLKYLISQNVDNLHLKSGIKLEILAELHGNTTLMKCLKCGIKKTFEEMDWDKRKWGSGYRTAKVRDGQPTCPECGSRIINSIVNFGDPLPDDDLYKSYDHSENCDVFIVIGSSLTVTPAANLPPLAYKSGAKLIIINKQETAYDHIADIKIEESAGDVMSAVIKRVKEILRIESKQ